MKSGPRSKVGLLSQDSKLSIYKDCHDILRI